MSNRKCCAKCKTPYNCGNPGCPCHKGTREDQEAWARAQAERDSADIRFHMDAYRSRRDPDGMDNGLGPVRKNYGD